MGIEFSNLVFINYVPGSYGSFLGHCLRETIRTDIFTDNNTTHTYEDDPFPTLHDHHKIIEWADTTHDEKMESMYKFHHIYESKLEKNKLLIQRATNPKATQFLCDYFPGSKIIKINIDNYCIYHVANNVINKIENIPISDAVGFVCDTINNENIEGVYNLSVRSFLNGKFIQEINHIRRWLDLKIVDITELYEEFKRRNGIHI
jgi:hypothetical protein